MCIMCPIALIKSHWRIGDSREGTFSVVLLFWLHIYYGLLTFVGYEYSGGTLWLCVWHNDIFLFIYIYIYIYMSHIYPIYIYIFFIFYIYINIYIYLLYIYIHIYTYDDTWRWFPIFYSISFCPDPLISLASLLGIASSVLKLHYRTYILLLSCKISVGLVACLTSFKRHYSNHEKLFNVSSNI